MAKKGKARTGQERLRLYRLHYECVRRNARYQKELKALRRRPSPSEMSQEFLGLDWGILRGDALPDPAAGPSLDQALSRPIPEELGEPIFPGEFVTTPEMRQAMETFAFAVGDMRMDEKTAAGLVVLAYFPERDPEHFSVTALDIRWAKKDLMESFESWVDATLAERARAGLKQGRPRHRLRLDESSQYLRVYDLRSEGTRFAEIGGLMWKGSEGDLEKKAKEYHQKGKSLVLNPPLLPRKTRTVS
jgi:hypothetical protein